MIANILTNRIVNDIAGGASQGVIIGLVALCLVLVWRATRVLNFAQGPMAMFVTYIGMTQMDHHVNFWLAAVISMVCAPRCGTAGVPPAAAPVVAPRSASL